jgi:L,D-transpeptidase YcbB
VGGARADHATSEDDVFIPLVFENLRQGAFRRGAAAALTAWLGVLTAPGAGAEAVPSGAPVMPVSLPTAPVADSEIKIRLDSPSGLAIAGARLHVELLRRFYAAYNYEPVWSNRQPQAGALLELVLRADEHGLDPGLFHAALLRNAAALASIDRDLLLSDAFLGYADALARGAVPFEERMEDEDLTPEPVDVAGVLASAIAGPNPAAAIEALAPNSPAYLAMRRALQAYRAAATAEVSPPPAGAARGRPPAHPAMLGNEARARQIAVNLERLRWLPRHLPVDRVWVNTASAQLVLYRNDQPIFTTRVVVGEIDKQTPELQTSITSLLFNPPWNVPRSIAETEIMPRVSRDPSYLSRHHMVVRRNGAIQQLPGPGAALGQLKFEMPNRFDVYLHDTPLKALFSRDNRRQSHGCVRVQNPRELAALLVGEPVEAINKGIALGYTNRRMLPQPVPVFVVYQTAFADATGAIEFRPDVYQRDAEIWEHLHRTQQPPVAQQGPSAQPRG